MRWFCCSKDAAVSRLLLLLTWGGGLHLRLVLMPLLLLLLLLLQVLRLQVPDVDCYASPCMALSPEGGYLYISTQRVRYLQTFSWLAS